LPGPERDLELLTTAARAAGDIAMRYFRNDPERWEKADEQGPVTQADMEVNAALESQLRGARPDYGWMSEESADEPERLSAARVFIIDPIDGTRAFIDGNTAFAHAIAVAEAGRIVAGAVYLPAQDKLYAAAAGQGATLNGAPIAVRRPGRAGSAQVLSNRAALEPKHWPGGVPDVERVFRPSLAYRLCLVAEGRFDAMVTFRNAWEWDTAAGTLIAAEAGAAVSDGQGREMCFNAPSRAHDGCIVAAPKLHADLLRRRFG